MSNSDDQYKCLLVEKMREALPLQKLLSFFQQKISATAYKVIKHLMS